MVPYKYLFRSVGCPVTVKMDLELHVFVLKTWPTREQVQTDVLKILMKLCSTFSS